MQYADALRYLDEHSSYERTGRVDSPSTKNIEILLDAIANPQHSYRSIHITGTNGKGSTAQIITKLLMAHGLRVGTYSSPHINRINDRICINGEPIDDTEFGLQIGAIADLEILSAIRPSFFEIMTAAMFRWFADEAVDVAVVEVGMLGRWDATNVIDSDVAVITNIALDHMEYAGPTVEHIAKEKAGIIKSSSALILGETDELLREIFLNEPARSQLIRDEDFACEDNFLAIGGRMITVRTPRSKYEDILLPLHGQHQGDNASLAICAVEAFFDDSINRDVLDEAMSMVAMPGRFEVLGHRPLVIIDGAHNPAGAKVCAEVFFEDFNTQGRKIIVMGALRSRNPEDLLVALRANEFDVVITCMPPTPRGLPADEMAAVAQSIGCADVRVADSVEKACELAMKIAQDDDAVLVTGSLYIVSAARPYIQNRATKRT
ncbi:MAG: bifunctional folylpolyglutamate synthase/dihydrofolate synthase [Ilumatobacteraceae bacterium]|nr:bifunctional folylpolyglutamate synthase/dihydrofolate synthase [Ilumatobacteraceae bacterium]